MKLKYGPYSPSRLDTATCGYSFYRQYVDLEAKKRGKVGSLPQDRGSAVHEIFEKVTKRLCEGERTVFSEAEVRMWVTEAVGKYPAAYPEAGQILEMCRMYINKPPKLLVKDAGVELHLAVKMQNDGEFVECDYNDPEAFARGRADIMIISDDTTTAVIYDHKTQPNVEEADTFQLGFYAWVISKIYPFLNEIQTVLHFARYAYYSEPYVWTREDLAKIEDEILTRISIIEGREDWPAIPHKNCQYCPFIAECPAVAEFITVGEHGDYNVKSQNLKILGDTQKAVKLAGLLNILEETVKITKSNLKNHVEQFGPIAIQGKIYEFKASEPKVDWDVVNKKLRPQTYELFDKNGVDPKPFMGFSQTFSTGIWLAENERLVKELAELFPRKVETTFRGVKA